MKISAIDLLSNHHMNAINRLKDILVEKQRTSKAGRATQGIRKRPFSLVFQ